MKILLVAEYRAGQLLTSYNELLAFAEEFRAETVMFLAGKADELPDYDGTVYFADAGTCGEYNPAVHKKLIVDVVEKEEPDMIVLPHSSYGWDLAPRIAFALEAAQVSEVVEVVDSTLVVPVCNAKLRRKVEVSSLKSVVTIQAGAFGKEPQAAGPPTVIKTETDGSSNVEFIGYEEAEQGGVDLGKAKVIVSGGRGIGKPENIEIIMQLAAALGGEYGASRPVVDAEWAEHNRQVGTTGQTVAPKLYIACGISGAIQHLAGMKKSEFIVAVNTDRDAPINEVSDISIIADLRQFLPVLTEKLVALQ